ncbi:tRNA 2-thiocytidine(32) synthetase TtcA [Colwellia sp. 4_MG-2023]|uniref:tRNA 2-thiocytidine(32) synthetase TtcA n=1 Tax=unclassified Colwellia TaxID=196834 RepID=UPI001C08F207|nr:MULTISPECIES: tRNA 2-thiocytidine(32) synthetase TtcA [unclassified Colwellia]MBU2924317.1 tRNA 2-thiocytidine(32) synthetase TtcA [Colwellia sp. C2M11]MDO6505460.1 tRNA 2-thiocytidine(32) synthetase TtcA [Colwellia sp. 5_MG-2023]MDO6554244.1 tRNA 2-thiocytidine(32) synthetase TtcA [Colwellia sp. 4_MG-2023]MDO6650881.1 tRNA 2-thiocytidine(32) synthetase TtcA [Colwellia sp. 3_MG-2023]MDO6663916.1 tRNA 2-thiocytidine(32) synthetase TtcA [Colwellia sp. 2_MG-2023]
MNTQQAISNKLEKKIRHLTGKAVSDYNMIEEGDKILCAISGGKDSFVMLDTLLHLKRVAPIKFDVIAVNLDQKQPGFPEHILPNYLEEKGIDYYIIDKDTYSVVKQKVPEGKTTCALCSRLRRGSLYGFAEKIGATKIALGHHMDDIVETLMMNMFNNAKLKAMPPKLLSDDKRNVVIRPLSYCREKDIEQLSEVKSYPIIPCNLCGSQENLQRKQIKKMLNTWDQESPGRVESVFKSTQSVSLSQLSDHNLYDFSALTIDRTAEPKEQEFGGADISSSNLIDVKNIEIIDAS